MVDKYHILIFLIHYKTLVNIIILINKLVVKYSSSMERCETVDQI